MDDTTMQIIAMFLRVMFDFANHPLAYIGHFDTITNAITSMKDFDLIPTTRNV